MAGKKLSVWQRIVNKIEWTFFRESGRTQLNDTVKVYVVSYPKSGRTWLRMLMGKYLCTTFNFDEQHILNTVKLTKDTWKLGGDRATLAVNWIHDGSGLTNARDFRKYRTDKSIFKDKKIIFLYRNPKDTIVSAYFQATKRITEKNRYSGTISQFVRDRRYGARKIIDFYNLWYEKQDVPEDFLLIRYEDLHADTAGTLAKVLQFIGAQSIDEAALHGAIEFCQFSNMKKREQQQALDAAVVKPGDRKDSESYKTRKGKVGGYADYLSPEDIAYIDRTIAQRGCPFSVPEN